MAYAINYKGLKKRETYDELIDYLANRQEKITYPDRRAKQFRTSPELSNLLDGEGMGIVNIEQQQVNIVKEQQKEHAMRQVASESNGTTHILRAAASQTDRAKK